MINWGAWLGDEISFLCSFMWRLFSKKCWKERKVGRGKEEGGWEINEKGRRSREVKVDTEQKWASYLLID